MGITDALNRHDVPSVFEALEDAIHTGATGTDGHDMKLRLVSWREAIMEWPTKAVTDIASEVESQ